MTQTIVVKQHVQELMYDIQNKAYLTGASREAEGSKNFGAASNIQASDDEEEGYQLKRSLANAFTALKSMLGEYLSENTTTSNNTIGQEIDNNGTLILSFKLPSNYNNPSADSLGNSIHAYLVDTALSEWFSITDKEDAEIYIAHAKVSLENILRALYKRSRPTRPKHNGE